jgi:diacylglycerol kinase family enzyme
VFLRGFDRRNPRVRLSWGPSPDQRRDDLFLAIFQNASPYTFLGRREMRLCPGATLDDHLEGIGLDTMRTSVAIRVVLSAFGSGRHVRHRHVVYVRAQPRFEIRCDEPMPVQVDGEFIGEHADLTVESVPDALHVLS